MSDVEQQLRAALAGSAEPVRPAEDLFARVTDVVAADRRRRRSRVALAVVAVVAAVAVAVLVVTSLTTGRPVDVSRIRPVEGGTMSWWVLELVTNAVLIGIALWLGPFIKRFGRAYAADVFHDNPLTGKSYLVLTDIVYYLICAAYVLAFVAFQPESVWAQTVSARQLQDSAGRIAGILLVLGVLHGLNLVVMPVLGRVFSLNRRLVPPTTLAPSQREAIHGDGDAR